MSLTIEGIKKIVTEAPVNIRNAILGSREELIKPSSLSLWIRERTKIPGRERVADAMEEARFSFLGPINLARVCHEQVNMHPVVGGCMAIGIPLIFGLSVRLMGGDPLMGVSTLATTYMAEGYYMNNQEKIDSRVGKTVRTLFRKPQGMNSLI